MNYPENEDGPPPPGITQLDIILATEKAGLAVLEERVAEKERVDDDAIRRCRDIVRECLALWRTNVADVQNDHYKFTIGCVTKLRHIPIPLRRRAMAEIRSFIESYEPWRDGDAD